jgi:hypothetical protein
MKWLVILLGFVTTGLIVAQLAIGQSILVRRDDRLIKIHQHFGYLTVAVSLLYLLISMITIASSMKSERKS